MKNIYGKHSFYFSALAIIFSVIVLIFGKNLEFFNQSVVPFICLFLILSIGVSHGALDNYKANKILKIYKMDSKLVFYFSYIFISILIILSWIFFSIKYSSNICGNVREAKPIKITCIIAVLNP